MKLIDQSFLQYISHHNCLNVLW